MDGRNVHNAKKSFKINIMKIIVDNEWNDDILI
jgi:hypothetical protein